MIPCAIYARVSTDEQTTAGQLVELRRAAELRGYAVTLEIEETGSGARGDRPGWTQVLQAATRGDVRAVLVAKLDRAGRSVLDVLAQLERLRTVGAVFEAVDQGLTFRPGGDAASTLMLHILAAVAEFERAIIRERTRAGLRQAARSGRKPGRPRAAGLPQIDVLNVLALRRQGVPWGTIAASYSISARTLRRWLDDVAARGEKGPPEAAG